MRGASLPRSLSCGEAPSWRKRLSPDEQMIEDWYRSRGLLQGNMTTRWVESPNGFSETFQVIDNDKSATAIQKVWRGFLDRRYVEDLRAVMAAGLRVFWKADGEMVVINLGEAATHIQKVYRGWKSRTNQVERETMRRSLACGEVAHGLSRGGKNNPLGSFKVSKKKGTVLADGFVFQKGGDQRWAVGMKAEDYCPCHTKIDIGKQYLCLCQCASTLIARANQLTSDREAEIVAKSITELIFT